MDSLSEKKMRAYLVGDMHRFPQEDKTVRRPCYYCLAEDTHTTDCPSRSDGEESAS
jgi:hypothetical protein